MLFLAQKERLDGFSTRRVRFANSLFYVPFCSAKRWTKSSSLSKQIHIYKKKKHKGKILVLFLAQKERLDGFSTRRVRFANSLFYVPFCSAKRWTKSSSLSKQIHIYKKKKHKGKILVLFLAQKERLDGFSTRRVRFANSLFYVPFCSAKRWTKSSSLSKQIHIYKKKKHKGKILVLFLAQKERLDGFSTRRVRFANSLFYVPFCSAKRWTKSSSLSKQIHIYKKKKHKGKILVLFLAQKERLELSRRLPDLRP